MNPSDTSRKPAVISGRWVVVAMFALGILATAFLWIYTYLHAAPFSPLRKALAEEFVDSAPEVNGGRRKIHKSTPPLLYIGMRVEFDPEKEQERAEAFALQVAKFTANHHDVGKYEVLEILLWQANPENRIPRRTTTIPVSELLE